MGQSKKMHEEVVTVDMSLRTWEDIPDYVKQEMEIKKIEPKNFDYSFDPLWCELKEKNNGGLKVYKEMKKREHYLRHRKTGNNE